MRSLAKASAFVILSLVLSAAAQAQTTYYVWASGNDSDGQSWPNAFKTITNAVAHAAGGDTIWVTNGTYDVVSTNYGSGVEINAGITLRSVNGPAVTTIRRNGGNSFRVFHLKAGAAGATVAGFTITGGRTAILMDGGAGARVDAGTVSNCWLVSNTSVQPATRNYRFTAAGVHVDGGTVVDCVIANNTAQDYLGGRGGGGVYITNGLVLRCTITNNAANGVSSDNASQPCARGGGVYFEGNGGTVERCFIARNQADTGGGVYLVGGGALRNCIVADNRIGGGIYMTGGTVESCTIAGNAPSWWQTISGLSQSGGTVLNCAFGGNSEGYSPRITLNYVPINKTGGSLTYCAVQETVAGAGNMVTNPLFLDPTRWDYRLATNSPAINAGSNLGWMTGAADYDGDSRLVGTVDIGAQEEDATAGPLRVSWAADATLGTNSLNATFRTAVAGADTAGLNYTWTFGDGSTSNLTSDTVGHTYGPGLYNVTLVLSNGSGAAATMTRSGYIKVLTDDAIHVRTGGGNTSPYTNWTMAATDIRAAVNLANGRVIVSNGVYGVTETLLIDRGIRIESVNGPTVTAIRASAAVEHVNPYRVIELLPTAAGAVLSGFAISNGYTQVQRGGGAGVQIWAGTVTNCHIVKNTADQYAARNYRMTGCGANVFGGLLVDSLVANNYGYDYVGTRGAVYVTNGVVRGCVITNNVVYPGGNDNDGVISSVGGGVCLEGDGVVENCFISGNSAYYGGGAALLGRGTLRNCLVKSSLNGSGIYMTGGVVQNCTVANNTAGGSGWTYSGLYMTGGTTVNTIVYYNVGGNAVEKTGGVFTFCQSESAIAGVSNATTDPSFVNRLAGDFRLAGGSPCIDTGTNLNWVATATDLAGGPRLVNAAVDRGAYENNPNVGPLTCGFTTVPTVPVASGSLEASFTATANGSNVSDLVYYWDLGDGVTIAGGDRLAVTNTYGPGAYTVRLAVTNGAGEGAFMVKPDHVIVRTLNPVYVATNGSHTSPFTTLPTAATNLHTAISVADALVLVGDGTYDPTAEIALSRPITLRSLNGKDRTRIRRASGVIRLFNITTNATVDGFTIADADTGGQGGGVYMTDGLVQNCTITNNRANSGGGGVYMLGGTVQNCVILRNWGAGGGDGCGGVQMGGSSKLRSCLVTANEGVDRAGGIRIFGAGCEVDSCTVVGNYGGYNYAGILADLNGPVIRNTIAVDNKNGGSVQQNFNLWNGAAAYYSCGPDVAAGSGNVITNTPGFWTTGSGTPGLTYLPGDYRIRDGSPCVNTGTNLPWMAGAKSLLGNARITGGRVEMGAYEQPSAGSVFLVR